MTTRLKITVKPNGETIIRVMGVTGTTYTTVGREIAKELGVIDARSEMMGHHHPVGTHTAEKQEATG